MRGFYLKPLGVHSGKGSGSNWWELMNWYFGSVSTLLNCINCIEL
jgi:hypothetical protein